MTTREHLIYQLQQAYALLRDVLPQMDSMRHENEHQRIDAFLLQAQTGLRGEIDTLERALNLLGVRVRMERSPLAIALHESTQRMKHQWNPSREQLEAHALLTLLTVTQMTIGMYLGAIELARAIGEHDVALLAQENNTRENEGLRNLRVLLSHVLGEISRAETRRAA